MKKISLVLAIAIAMLTAGAAFAAEKQFKLKIEPGDFDRPGSVVSLLVEVPDEFKTATVTIDGKSQPAQIGAPALADGAVEGKKRVKFIMPEMKKGEAVEAVLTVSTEETIKTTKPMQAVWVEEEGGQSRLLEVNEGNSGDSDPVIRYMCKDFDSEKREETYKVFHHVLSPSGEPLTKGPGGLYTHHRGIFFGFSKVTYDGDKKCDIWHCNKAHQEHAGVIAEENGPIVSDPFTSGAGLPYGVPCGRQCVAVDWIGEVGETKVFAKEQRELDVAVVMDDGEKLVIDFTSKLTATDGPVQLDGDPQHAGFHFRASQKVADGDQKLTYYLRAADGKGAPGETRNWPGNKEMVNLPWEAMSFEIDGGRWTVLYIDHPENPKEARYSERSYGRFGSYFVTEFDKDSPLLVKYRLVILQGELTQEQAQRLADDFVNPVKVEMVD